MQLINPEIRIENTSACNAKCTICPREKMTRPKTFMPLSHFESLVEQGKSMGANLVSVFGYGEPLLDRDIVKRIQYCTNLGLDTFITTNGSLLKIDMAKDLLTAGLTHIRFSVHGLYDSYDKVHRGLKFETILRNISNFRQIQLRDAPFCRVSISVIPMNGEDIETLKAVWDGYELEIWKPHNWGPGRKYRKTTKKRKKTCGRVHSGPVQIQADGNVIPCCFLTNGEVILGNTYKDSIEEILKGDPYQVLRELHESGDLDGLPCKTCDQLNYGDTALLYSTVDPTCQTGKTSSTKFKLKEM